MGFAVGEAKRGALVGKSKGPWQRNNKILNEIFFREEKTKTREAKRPVKL